MLRNDGRTQEQQCSPANLLDRAKCINLYLIVKDFLIILSRAEKSSSMHEAEKLRLRFPVLK